MKSMLSHSTKKLNESHKGVGCGLSLLLYLARGGEDLLQIGTICVLKRREGLWLTGKPSKPNT